jgi:hypothetical protein
MNFPGNSPLELAPYLAPGNTDVLGTVTLLQHMRRQLSDPDLAPELTASWSKLVRTWLKAHARQQRNFGFGTHTLVSALYHQKSDLVLLRFFLILAQEFVI